MLFFIAGQTSQSIIFVLQDSSSTTGAGLTGLTYNSSGLEIWYKKGGTGALTQITLASLVSDESTWTSGGFVEVDSTNAPGWYRLDLPDTAVSTEEYISIIIKGATNLVETSFRVECRLFPSDLRNIQGDSTSATDFKSIVDTDFNARTLPSGEYFNYLEDGVFLSNSYESDLVDAVWDETLSLASHNTDGTTGQSLRHAGIRVSIEGAVAASGTDSSFVSNLTESTDDFYTDQTLTFLDGGLAGQTRPITGYTGVSKTITFDEPFSDAPNTNDNFVIHSDHVHPISQISDGIWDKQTVGHTDAGSFGYQLSTVLDDVPNNSEFQARTLPSGDYNSGSSGGDATLANQESILTLLNYESGVIDSIYEDTNELQQSQSNWLTADISSLPTLTQLQERSLPSGDYFNPTEDDVSISSSSLLSIADSVWDEVITNSAHNGANTAGKRLRQAGSVIAADGEVNDATPSSGEFITNLTEVNSSFYSDQCLIFTSGALTGQGRVIDSYNGGTKTVHFDEPFSFSPSNGDEFSIFSQHVHPVSEIAYGVWSNPSGEVTEGTFGYVLSDIPSNSEFEARTLPSGDYFNPSEDNISVDLSSVTDLLNDMPTYAQLQARTLPSGEYLSQDDVKDLVIETEGSYTLQQTLSIVLSVLSGQSSGSGLIFKTPNGNATRVTAVVDEDRNRTSITLNPSS